MHKYLSFFRLSFMQGLQYRTAALAGMVTQFAWGFLEIMVFQAFFQAEPGAFPMTISATASYIWMQQAFLALFATWMMDNGIFLHIQTAESIHEVFKKLPTYANCHRETKSCNSHK